tara:strand:+ start:191 stop:442 length:252 start_codon:yes stop_codon:yes gene_type:complete
MATRKDAMTMYVDSEYTVDLLDDVTDLLNTIDGILEDHEYEETVYSYAMFQEIDRLYGIEGVDEMFTEMMLDNFDYDRGEDYE